VKPKENRLLEQHRAPCLRGHLDPGEQAGKYDGKLTDDRRKMVFD
jgi:hypothetical protein